MIQRYGIVLWAVTYCLLAGCAGTDKKNADAFKQLSVTETTGYRVDVHELRDEEGNLLRRVEALIDDEGDYLLDTDGNLVAHGLKTEYWPNGQKRSEVQYVNGVRHGPRTAWYESGQIWSYGEHVQGKPHGVWTVWFPTGRKSQEYHFDHGAQHGLYTEWHANGTKKREVEFVRGQRQGPLTIWDEQGQVARQVHYVDGEPQPSPGFGPG